MTRTLSSSQTFVMKVLFPVLWIGGFTILTFSILSGKGDFHQAPGGPSRTQFGLAFLVVTIVGAVFIWWASMRLKRVRLDGSVLRISNYLREIQVPLAEIAEVRENRWLNIRPIALTFIHPTPFGNRVLFMPRVKWFLMPWTPHPIAEELRTMLPHHRSQAT